jgi:hypothetical protein
MSALKLKPLITVAVLLILWVVVPDAANACSGCFGALADSATIRAISASMLVLVGLMAFMGGGIFSFFKRSHERAELNSSGNQLTDDE